MIMAKAKTDAAAGATTPGDTQPFEEFARQDRILAADLAALRVHTGWAVGRPVTRKAFDDALKKVRGEAYGG